MRTPHLKHPMLFQLYGSFRGQSVLWGKNTILGIVISHPQNDLPTLDEWKYPYDAQQIPEFAYPVV